MVGQKLRNGVAGCFWLRVSYEVFIQMSSRAAVRGRLEDWRICIPGGSLTDMAGSWCRLLAKVPDSHQIDVSVGLIDYSHDVVASFLRSERPKRKYGGTHVFYGLVSEVILVQHPPGHTGHP